MINNIITATDTEKKCSSYCVLLQIRYPAKKPIRKILIANWHWWEIKSIHHFCAKYCLFINTLMQFTNLFYKKLYTIFSPYISEDSKGRDSKETFYII